MSSPDFDKATAHEGPLSTASFSDPIAHFMRDFIERATGKYAILVSSTGAATGLAGILTSQPGSSRVFLGGTVPYHTALLADYLKRDSIEHAVAEEVAVGMANESYLTGQEALIHTGQISQGEPTVLGVGITAAIASGPRRGKDRMCIAIRSSDNIYSGKFEFEKGEGAGDREWQNALAERIALNALGGIVGVPQLPMDVSRVACDRGSIYERSVVLDPLPLPVVTGADAVLINCDGTVGSLEDLDPQKHIIFPGSFKYFHCGHDLGARSGKDVTGKTVIFEITAHNADKDAVGWEILLRRSVQFRGRHPVILRMDAGPFVHKALSYPQGMEYIVGFDTAERILSLEFYDNDPRKLKEALDCLDARGSRFHVLGRTVETPNGKEFQTYKDLWCPLGKAHLFSGLRGQLDVSSTALSRA